MIPSLQSPEILVSPWLQAVDLLGVAVFAVSGTLMAHRKRMDGFGVIVLATVTAIGGGTVRDTVLNVPVAWTREPLCLYAILAAALLSVLWLRSGRPVRTDALLVADAIGLAFFNVLGLEKALALGTSALVAVMMGTISGVFGGLIRDVICREVPLVLRTELYAMTCVAGGCLYVALASAGAGAAWCMAACVVTTLVLRLLAIRHHWHLPVFDYAPGNGRGTDE